MNNLLFVIYEPAQLFNSSISASLLQTCNNIVKNIRCTTREINPGEVDGKNYFFISKLDFLGRVAKGELLEYSQGYDGYYATDKNFVLSQLESKDVMLEMEADMTRQVKVNYPQAVSILIVPKSIDAFVEKMKQQKRTNIQIEPYITKLQKVLKDYQSYDYLIVNEEFDKTKQTVLQILDCERYKSSRQKTLIEEIIDK